MNYTPSTIVRAALLIIMTGLMGSAQTQESIDAYPSKPVIIISPVAGASATDTSFRLYTQNITAATGKQFVIDPKPGVGGTLAGTYVARAAPDGYTLMAVNSAFTIIPSAYPNLSYDTIRDFSPIVILTKQPYLLLINPASPYQTLPDYIAYARGHPGDLNFSTLGQGGASHLPGAMLHNMTNTKVTFVHYRNNQKTLDLISGRVHATVLSYGTSIAHLKAGKLRAIAITSTQRLGLLPDVPSISEYVPGYDFSNWIGMVAPAKTSPAIVEKLNDMFVKVGRDPEINRKLAIDGSITNSGTPEQFKQLIAIETVRWRKLIEDTGIKIEQ